MKSLIKSFTAFIVSIIGLIGGIIWILQPGEFQMEPLILIAASCIEILGFIFLRIFKNEDSQEKITNSNQVILNFTSSNQETQNTDSIKDEKRKSQTQILFIDDNYTQFQIVSILKKSGWINTKSIKDVTDLDDLKVKEADIIFVDINGVGTTLFQDQGLGLASALKKKYPLKKIILYSAETTGDRFHKALREVDNCLPKDAEPYQFIELIDSYAKL